MIKPVKYDKYGSSIVLKQLMTKGNMINDQEDIDRIKQGEDNKRKSTERWLTEVEVSKLIGVTRATLQNWRWRNVGIPYSKFMRSVRYKESDLNAYMESGRTCYGQLNASKHTGEAAHEQKHHKKNIESVLLHQLCSEMLTMKKQITDLEAEVKLNQLRHDDEMKDAYANIASLKMQIQSIWTFYDQEIEGITEISPEEARKAIGRMK
jgi:hypothetical protein